MLDHITYIKYPMFSFVTQGPTSLMESVTESLSYMTSGSQTEPKMTIGAMDLGGASTQITFVPEDPSLLPPSSSYFLRLYGTDYHVYSHSYLCYGINEVLRGYKALLVQVRVIRLTVYNRGCPKNRTLKEPCAFIYSVQKK